MKLVLHLSRSKLLQGSYLCLPESAMIPRHLPVKPGESFDLQVQHRQPQG